MSETVDLSSEVHARCHEGRWFRRAKELERERDGALKLAGIRADALVKAERERDEARAVIGRLTDEAITSEFGRTAALAREAVLREALEKLTAAGNRLAASVREASGYREPYCQEEIGNAVVEWDTDSVAARAALRVEVAPAEEAQDGSHEPAIGSGSISRPKDGSR